MGHGFPTITLTPAAQSAGMSISEFELQVLCSYEAMRRREEFAGSADRAAKAAKPAKVIACARLSVSSLATLATLAGVSSGWTDPKMPAHYIAQANREKLGISGVDKIVAFDQSQNTDDFLPLPGANIVATNGENRVVTLRSNSRKKA
jgi:hypothetical protein